MLRQVQGGPLSPDSPLHIRPLRMTFVMGGNSHAGSRQYIMRNAWLDEAQGGIKIAGRNINNLRYADDYHPYGRKRRRIKELLYESERGE